MLCIKGKTEIATALIVDLQVYCKAL